LTGERSSYPALLLVCLTALAPVLAEAQTRASTAAPKPQTSACCTASDLLLCRDFQLCHPFASRSNSAKRGERLQDRATLAFGPKLLQAGAPVVSLWTPTGSGAAQAQFPAAGPQLAATVTTRAGHIRDNEAEPEFPIITQGQAVWSARPDGPDARIVQVVIKIDADALHVELVFRATRSLRAPTITVIGRSPAAASFMLDEMPRARRAGAVEGEPLIGRIAPGPEGGSRVELSGDPIDLANNKRRLLGTPWLDVRLTNAAGKTSIVTIEKGKPATDMLGALFD